MNTQRRLAALRARLESESVPAFVVSDPVNVAYLTDFVGVFDGEDAHALVITADAALLYTDRRYSDAATRAARDTEFEVVTPREHLYITLCTDLTAAGFEGLALEESVPHGRFRFVSEQFSGNVVVVDQWVEELRKVKEAGEIERIAQAQELADQAFERILSVLRPGVTEREVALELEVTMRRAGSDGVAFPPIVASGPNSALPHAKAGDRPLGRGDQVTLDFGARVEGYCSDMTRTVVLGSADDRQREIHATVLAANAAGIAATRPGVPGSSIDAAARSVIEEAGFGEYFAHGTGHGVGMAVHELPSISPRGTKSVPENSVITIEPGVYMVGFGGVRIEDLVVVEQNGARVLSRSPKDLIEI